MSDPIDNHNSEQPGLQLRMRGCVACLSFCRPDTRNAFTEDTAHDLLAVLDQLEADLGCKAILLTGTGPAFCSGQDLRQRDPRNVPFPPDLTKTVTATYIPVIQRLRSVSCPVVASVNGVAAGAGIGIALACDVTLAASDARFVFAFSRIGLVPDAGTTWFLTQRMGEARARALAMTSGILTGAEAAEFGLIWKAHPAETLMNEARTLAQALGDGPTEALVLTRQAFAAASQNSLDDQLTLEARLQGQAGRHPDYAEGVLAFLEKRAPVFGSAEPPID